MAQPPSKYQELGPCGAGRGRRGPKWPGGAGDSLGGSEHPAEVERAAGRVLWKEEELGEEYGSIEQGVNDCKVRVWRGPKLPNYSDRFEFKLYALDADMHFDNRVTKEKLLDAIAGHVAGEAVLMTTF